MTQSAVIYQGYGYTACKLKSGILTVQYRGKGSYIRPGPQADLWIEAIQTAIDPQEAHALCKAVLNA